MLKAQLVGKISEQFHGINFYHQEARLIGVDSRTLDASACTVIVTTIESGALRSSAAGLHRYALKEAIAAYEQVQNRSASGRVLLTTRSRVWKLREDGID